MPNDLDAYRQTLINLYLRLPDTPRRLSRFDLRLTRQLWERQIPLTVIETAFLLASVRRAARPPDAIRLGPIRSLHYFLPVIEELLHNPLRHGDTYLAYLRAKVPLHPAPATNSSNGETSEEAKRWAQRRYKQLDQGRWKSLLVAVCRHALHSKAARDCLQYLRRNRQRMRYPEFHAQGLCTSSGVVEAGCKGVIGTRLKRGGMHWTVRGANAIIALRCCKLSGRFEGFWEQRSYRSKVA